MSDIHALSGAYAVDAVDDIERASFERHLASCPTCQAEVASLREASALLADAATTTPPPELRDAVLSGITRVRPLPPVTVGGPVHRRRWFPALVAAVVLALVGVGGAVWQPWRDDTSPTGKVYQLWLQTPSEDMVSAGLMPAGASTALLDGNADDAIGVGVSLEPAGGSEQPTEVVALIDLGSA